MAGSERPREAGRSPRSTRHGDYPPDSDRFVVSAPDGTKQTQRVRAPVTADPRLDVLTLLGHRLPRTRNPEEAASEGTAALAALDLAATTSAVESDIAVVI